MIQRIAEQADHENPAQPGTGGNRLPKTFRPRFWSEADGRVAVIRQVKAMVGKLKQDCGAESYQRQLLCERAAFIAILLETQERDALDKGNLDAGSYAQQVNTLLGLLRTLGLDKRVKALGLKAYMEAKTA